MVNRFWQATGFCPSIASLPDGSGIVIGSSKRRICQVCKFLPKNTLFKSPAMVLFDPKNDPPLPPKPNPFRMAVPSPLPNPQNPPPPTFSAPGKHNLGCKTSNVKLERINLRKW